MHDGVAVNYFLCLEFQPGARNITNIYCMHAECATFLPCSAIFILEISLKFSGVWCKTSTICCSSLAMHQNSSADVTPGVEKTMRLSTHSPSAFYSAKKRLARLLHDGYNFMSCWPWIIFYIYGALAASARWCIFMPKKYQARIIYVCARCAQNNNNRESQASHEMRSSLG
jgi:hypothetical protein